MIEYQPNGWIINLKKMIHFNISTCFIVLLSIFTNNPDHFYGSATAVPYTDCPPDNLLKPCICTNHTSLIECSSGLIHGNILRYIFFDAHLNMSTTGHSNVPFKPKFNHLKLIHSPLETILNKSFSEFIFERITIENNYHLIWLETDTFVGTEQETIELNFKSNINLFVQNRSAENIFTIISKFIHLQSLTIDRCGLTYLPMHLIQKNKLIHLKKLTIINNPIELINSFALIHFPVIRLIDFSHNKIHSLKQSSFWLQSNEDCNESFKHEDLHYFVDLSHNNLTEYSFVDQSFNVSCTMEINLTNNNIQFLNETIFRPLFQHYTKLILFNNPLNCNDCQMDWLLKSRYCPETDRTIRYFTAIDSKCETMDYLNFILNCQPYSNKLQSLTLPFNSPPNFILNQYMEYYSNDFTETDDNLFKCSYSNKSTKTTTSFFDNFLAKLAYIGLVIKNFFIKQKS